MNYEMLAHFYKKMYKIRRFEETILSLFSENKLSGTTHTCIGQEAIAVASMNAIGENDIVFSNHRCHGHFIAYSDNIQILLAEIMGRTSGVCNGRGGSQHLCYKRFFSNGIQGGIVPNAVGMAWAEKLKGTDHIASVFIGDGTLGEGVVYESLNIASVFEIPILFIVENNEYAMSSRRRDLHAGTIKDRFQAFSIKCVENDDSDVEELAECFAKAVSYVREKKKPYCQIVNTYRLAAHSKGDDYREQDEINEHWKKDPLKRVEQILGSKVSGKIKEEVECELEKALEFCRNDSKRVLDVYAHMDTCFNEIYEESVLNKEPIKHVKQLNNALEKLLYYYPQLLLLGEDIKDPYGGAFKVTKGLSGKFPERVINTPISEAGFIGIGVGLAMNGMRPVVEIMFGDFLSLGFDQILNHATKYHWMYNGQVQVPLLIRVPSGGGRGYGATHSQSLEKYFIGIPDLTIIALSPLLDCGKLLTKIEKEIVGPTLLIENKKLYGEYQLVVDKDRVDKFYIEEVGSEFPLYKLYLDKEEKADVLIITYGEMLTMAMQVAKQLLIEDEILINIVLVTMIAPIEYKQLISSIEDEKYIVTLEEGTKRAGWGTEIVAGLCEKLDGYTFYRIGAKDGAISCNREEEEEILPNRYRVLNEIRDIVYAKNNN